jgi:hypothetical protein
MPAYVIVLGTVRLRRTRGAQTEWAAKAEEVAAKNVGVDQSESGQGAHARRVARVSVSFPAPAFSVHVSLEPRPFFPCPFTLICCALLLHVALSVLKVPAQDQS